MKAEEPTGWTIGQLAQVSGAASLIVKLFRPDKDTNSASKKQSLFFIQLLTLFSKNVSTTQFTLYTRAVEFTTARDSGIKGIVAKLTHQNQQIWDLNLVLSPHSNRPDTRTSTLPWAEIIREIHDVTCNTLTTVLTSNNYFTENNIRMKL